MTYSGEFAAGDMDMSGDAPTPAPGGGGSASISAGGGGGGPMVVVHPLCHLNKYSYKLP